MSSNDGILKAINPTKINTIVKIIIDITGLIHCKSLGNVTYTPIGLTIDITMTSYKNFRNRKRFQKHFIPINAKAIKIFIGAYSLPYVSELLINQLVFNSLLIIFCHFSLLIAFDKLIW